MKKQLLSLALAGALLTAAAPHAGAYNQEQKNAADTLYSMGLFYGTDKGFELDRDLTRQEAVAMMVRLSGRETAALSGIYHANFPDVALWATGYVGYAQSVGLVSGYSAKEFGADDTLSANGVIFSSLISVVTIFFCVLFLRSAGYL